MHTDVGSELPAQPSHPPNARVIAGHHTPRPHHINLSCEHFHCEGCTGLPYRVANVPPTGRATARRSGVLTTLDVIPMIARHAGLAQTATHLHASRA